MELELWLLKLENENPVLHAIVGTVRTAFGKSTRLH